MVMMTGYDHWLVELSFFARCPHSVRELPTVDDVYAVTRLWFERRKLKPVMGCGLLKAGTETQP